MICVIKFSALLSFIRALTDARIGHTVNGNRVCLFCTDEQAEKVRSWLVGVGKEEL